MTLCMPHDVLRVFMKTIRKIEGMRRDVNVFHRCIQYDGIEHRDVDV